MPKSRAIKTSSVVGSTSLYRLTVLDPMDPTSGFGRAVHFDAADLNLPPRMHVFGAQAASWFNVADCKKFGAPVTIYVRCTDPAFVQPVEIPPDDIVVLPAAQKKRSRFVYLDAHFVDENMIIPHRPSLLLVGPKAPSPHPQEILLTDRLYVESGHTQQSCVPRAGVSMSPSP